MPMPRAIWVIFALVPTATSYAMGGLSRSVPQISRITMGPSDDATTLPGQAILPTLYYLQETARATPPEGLGALATLLCSRGEELCTPGRDASLLPLLVPLTRSPADGAVTGVLRWPTGTGEGAELPLVRTAADGRQLQLLATLPTHYLQRAAVLADAEGSADAAAVAAIWRDAGGAEIEPGKAAAGPGGVPGFLVTKVGPFIDEYEGLARGHLDKGSAQAALITCERSQSLFGAWGRPFAFHARMLAGLGRDEEARDLARQALSMPLWTLGDDLAEVCAIAQTTVEKLAATCRLRADGGLTPEQLRAQNGMDKRTKEQVALDKASYLLDLAVASPDDYSWESIRPELQQLYTEAKQVDVARQVGPIA